jgi:hypothetical protein
MAARKRPPQAQRGRLRSGGWLFRPIVGAISALTYYTLAVRPWLLRWGATSEEASTPLPGDGLVPEAAYTTTRAVTVRASAESIWPWLVQLGQARAGFYTYDRLEQIVGAAIRSAECIVPEFQHLAVGDTVLLSPVGGPKVAILAPGRALVLSQTMDLRTARSIPPAPATRWAMDWTWTFALRPLPDGATRLLVRTRADYRPHAVLAPVVRLLLEPIHFVMERGMLMGIKRRAEHAAMVPATIAGDPSLPATDFTPAAGPESSSTPAADRSLAWQPS